MSKVPEKKEEAVSPVNNDNDSNNSKKDAVERALDAMKPLAVQVSLGGIMGACSGMALKKVGKAVAFVVGLGFVVLQSAAYMGYLELNWKKIGNDAIVKPLDSVRCLCVVVFINCHGLIYVELHVLCIGDHIHACSSVWLTTVMTVTHTH